MAKKEWRAVNDLYFHSPQKTEQKKKPVTLDDEPYSQPQKDEPEVRLLDATWLPGSDGYQFNKKCKLQIKAKFLKKTSNKRVVADTFVLFNGEEEDLSQQVEGFLNDDGVAETELMLYYGDKYSDALRDNPDATCQYKCKVKHTKGLNEIESDLLKMPQEEVEEEEVTPVFIVPKVENKDELIEIDGSGDTGEIIQFVNLESEDEGRDGKGHEIIVKAGAQGDLAAGDDEKKGSEDTILFFNVKFSGEGGKKSKRNSPLTKVFEGLDISEYSVVKAGEEYEGKLKLGSTGGIGRFKIDVGLAGGDKCAIKLGKTEGAADSTITYINWRSLEYELIYPGSMAGKLNQLRAKQGNDEGKDIPRAIKNFMTERLSKVYLYYDLYKSKSFAEADAKESTWVTAAFLEDNTGGHRFIQASGWGVPDNPTFDANPPGTRMQVRLCDRAFSSNVRTTEAEEICEAVETTIASPHAKKEYMFAKSSKNGNDTITVTDYEWTADINPDDYKKMPTIEIQESGVAEARRTSSKTDALIEQIQSDGSTGNSKTVVFTKQGRIGNIMTDLKSSEKNKIKQFVQNCLDPRYLRSNGNKLTVKVTYHAGNARRKKRFDNIKSALNAEFNSSKQEITFHPALDLDGNPKSGSVDKSWFSYPTYKKLKITLPQKANPNDQLQPGDIAGPENDNTANIKIMFKIECTGGINGNSGGGEQLMVLKTGAEGANASTFCHELGHAMGMTIFSGMSKKSPGMDEPNHVDGGGVYYRNKKNGPFNNGYRNIHSGSHCAYGVPNADLPAENFNNKRGSCIMFGSGSTADNRTSFCPECTKNIRARRLEDVRGSWKNRSVANS